MTDYVTRQEAIDIAALVAREAIDNAARGDGGVRLPQGITRTGTLQAGGPPGATVVVSMDGDDDTDDQGTPVVNATGKFLYGSARVLVHFAFPQGAYAIGLLSSDTGIDVVQLYGQELTAVANNIDVPITTYDFDHLRIEVSARNDNGASVDDFVHVRLNGNSGGTDYRHGYSEETSVGLGQGEGDADNIAMSWCPAIGSGLVGGNETWPVGFLDLWRYGEARHHTYIGRQWAFAGFLRYVTHYAGTTQFSPAVVTSVRFYTSSGSFAVGSRFAIYGVGKRTFRPGLP